MRHRARHQRDRMRLMSGLLVLAGLLAGCVAADRTGRHDADLVQSAQTADATAANKRSMPAGDEGEISSRAILTPDQKERCQLSVTCRERQRFAEARQGALFQPTALTPLPPPQVPPPPANGGQCVIDITGQVNDTVTTAGVTTGLTIAYRHVEIQRWEVSGPPMQVPGIVGKVYSMQWSTTGNGSKDQLNVQRSPSGQLRSERHLTVWDIKNAAGPLPVRLTAWLRPSDNRWVINRTMVPNVGLVAKVTDSQQHTSDGAVDPTIKTLTGQWLEFPASFMNWTENGALTQVVNKVQSFPVGVAVGYAQIAPPPGKGSLTGGAQCVWNLSLMP